MPCSVKYGSLDHEALKRQRHLFSFQEIILKKDGELGTVKAAVV